MISEIGRKNTLFLIFLRIFLRDFSSDLVSGRRVGTGYPSAMSVRFSSSVSDSEPVEPFCKINETIEFRSNSMMKRTVCFKKNKNNAHKEPLPSYRDKKRENSV